MFYGLGFRVRTYYCYRLKPPKPRQGESFGTHNSIIAVLVIRALGFGVLVCLVFLGFWGFRV